MNAETVENSSEMKYRAEWVPLSFTVSVTGHRNLCTKGRPEDLQKLVSTLLAQISTCCLKHCPKTELRLISSLAAGADQIAASAIESAKQATEINNAWDLHVVLPFDKQSYVETLYEDILVKEFASGYTDQFHELIASASRVYVLADRTASLPTDSTDHSRYWRTQRFRTLGEILARQSDLLLAIWNGQPANGAGGTADVVRIALAQGKPVLRIDPDTLKVSYLSPGNGVVDPIVHARHPTWGPASELEDLFSSKGAMYKLTASILTFPSEGPDETHLLESAAGYFGLSSWGDNAGSETVSGFDLFRPKLSPWYSWIFYFKRAQLWFCGNTLPERTGSYSRWFVYKWLESKIVSQTVRRDERKAKRAVFRSKLAARLSSLVGIKSTQSVSPKNALTEEAHAQLPKQTATEPDNEPTNAEQIATDSQNGFNPPTSRFALRVNYAEDDWHQVVDPETTPIENFPEIKERPHHLDESDDSMRNAMISSDAIATHRGHVYRSSYVINFLGGALAVGIGLLGLFSEKQKFVFVFTELIILIFLIAFYKIALSRCWHRRWLNARHVTESLRAGRFLVWMGFGGRRSLKNEAPWSAWYSNAVMAASVLPNTALSADDIRYMATELRCHVKIQIDYHKGNANKLEKFHHGLDVLGKLCLVTAVFVAIVFVVFFDPAKCYGIDWCTDTRLQNVKYAVTVICAGGPVLAGALMGIRYQGDFERFAERSHETMQQLNRIDRRLLALSTRESSAEDPPLFEVFAGVVFDLLNIYESDLEDWRYVYAARPNPDVG